MGSLKLKKLLGITIGIFWGIGNCASAAEYSVYEVFRAIDLGESDRPPPKEIFINMGALQGLRKGSVLDVYRKISSFDNVTEKLAGEHVVPVGRIKVIHTDEKTAIARMDRFVSLEQEPALLPQSIMIGDLVRLAN
ncbi:MAG: hypothetical protein KGP28_02870 [Bdellovibrionales bacterium]|nr:hypothetical protein [Bdellovibrionales bacterium]